MTTDDARMTEQITGNHTDFSSHMEVERGYEEDEEEEDNGGAYYGAMDVSNASESEHSDEESESEESESYEDSPDAKLVGDFVLLIKQEHKRVKRASSSAARKEDRSKLCKRTFGSNGNTRPPTSALSLTKAQAGHAATSFLTSCATIAWSLCASARSTRTSGCSEAIVSTITARAT